VSSLIHGFVAGENESVPSSLGTTEEFAALLKDLKTKHQSLADHAGSLSEEGWTKQVGAIGTLTTHLGSLLDLLKGVGESKLKAREKKKRWRKRHLQKLKRVRDERLKRRENLHEQVDSWRAEWVQKDIKEREVMLQKTPLPELLPDRSHLDVTETTGGKGNR